MDSRRLSVSMALDAITDEIEALAEAEELVRHRRGLRDNLIRDARAAGISYPRLCKITGLSRDRIYTIVNAPDYAPVVLPALLVRINEA